MATIISPSFTWSRSSSFVTPDLASAAFRDSHSSCRSICGLFRAGDQELRRKATAALFAGHRVRSLPPAIHRRAYVKLQVLDAADSLDFLRVPPSNRLEPLRGEREGQWSIRINDQWRICFRWEGSDAQGVKITDPITTEIRG